MKAWRKYLQHRLKNPNLIIDIKALQINNKKLTLSKKRKIWTGRHFSGKKYTDSQKREQNN